MKIKYFHIIDSRKKVSPLRMKCIRSLRDKIGDNEYSVAEVPYSENIFEMIANVDRAKYEIGATMPNACVVDTDCFIAKPLHEFDLVKGFPYFAKYDYNTEIVAPDTYYFYVNGNTEWFKNNLPASLAKKDQYSLNPEKLQNLADYNLIPEMSYCHFYDSMRRVGDLAALDRAVKKLNELSVGIANLNNVVNSNV
jgi:hypothetical protein